MVVGGGGNYTYPYSVLFFYTYRGTRPIKFLHYSKSAAGPTLNFWHGIFRDKRTVFWELEAG